MSAATFPACCEAISPDSSVVRIACRLRLGMDEPVPARPLPGEEYRVDVRPRWPLTDRSAFPATQTPAIANFGTAWGVGWPCLASLSGTCGRKKCPEYLKPSQGCE